MVDVIPRILIIATRDDPVDLAQHVIEVPDGFAVLHFGTLGGSGRVNLPAVRDPHAGTRSFLFLQAWIPAWRPQRKHLRIAVNVQTTNAQRRRSAASLR